MPVNTLQARVLDFIRRERLLSARDRVLAAVSGGPDSVALLHLLVSLKEILALDQLTVVHFDHHLRGRESDEDRAFVEALAQRFGLPFVAGKEDVRRYRQSHGGSLEMAARACRHRFFLKAAAELDAQKIAVGHTANDQAEEVLLRLLRGTGPAGLAAMRPAGRHGIVRPLLSVSRTQIMDYIRDMELPWRQDRSNLEPVCQRNVLRLEVLPTLAKHFHPQIAQTLCRHARLARDEEDYWRRQVSRNWPKICIEETPSQVVLALPELALLHPALLRRVFRQAVERLKGDLLGFYAVHFELLEKWIGAARSGRALQLPGDIWAGAEGERLVISQGNPFSHQPFCWTITDMGVYSFAGLRVSVCAGPMGAAKPPAASGSAAWLDADQIEWPLTIRSWRPGDRFQPLGLKGSKKLQDFFTDARIPRSRRGRIPLLCDRKGICWVMGLRLDERVRVTAQSTRGLLVEFREV